MPPLDFSATSADYVAQLIQSGPVSGGGASPLSYATMRYLLEFQSCAELFGDLVEIGVLHGHTLGLLASTSREGERVIGADLSAAMLSRSRSRLEAELCDRLPWIAFHEVAGSSASLAFRRRIRDAVSDAGIRFAHIDGEHSFALAKSDLELVAELMAPWGLICLDDTFNLPCACVTEALFAFLFTSDWQLLLLMPNKAVACQSRYFPFYRECIQGLPVYLSEQHGMQVGLATSTHSPDHGYYSVFPQSSTFYQVVNKAFDSFSAFQSWKRHPEQS